MSCSGRMGRYGGDMGCDRAAVRLVVRWLRDVMLSCWILRPGFMLLALRVLAIPRFNVYPAVQWPTQLRNALAR